MQPESRRGANLLLNTPKTVLAMSHFLEVGPISSIFLNEKNYYYYDPLQVIPTNKKQVKKRLFLYTFHLIPKLCHISPFYNFFPFFLFLFDCLTLFPWGKGAFQKLTPKNSENY